MGTCLMEKGLCFKVMGSNAPRPPGRAGLLTPTEQEARPTTSDSFPRQLFILEVEGDRDQGIEALPIPWVSATRVSYVPVCCRP